MNNRIHWYPGHIAKAGRELKQKLAQVDVILEVLDARIPYSSKYQNSDELTLNKPKIILLNKSDLSDCKKNILWVNKIEAGYGHPVILTTAKNQKDSKLIISKILKSAQPVFEKLKLKGLLPRPVRVMVIGMPNVGKSSVINKLTGKAKAKTGAKAGVTRCQQWIRVHEKIELLDTPGIIDPLQSNQDAAVKLCMVNSISENAYDDEFIAVKFLELLNKYYPNTAKDYYKTHDLTVEGIARSRNWIIKNGQCDINRTAKFILTNFRDGKIGKITLEDANEF